MTFPFIVAELVRAPKLDVVNALAVGTKLVRVASEDAPTGVRNAVERLHGGLKSLRKAWKARRVAPTLATTRPVVLQLRGVWGAAFLWLQGWSKLPHDEVALASEANAVFLEVFPGGMRFSKLEHDALWIESGHALDVFKAHRATVERLGGQVFLTQLQAAHAACGEALGMTAAPAQAPAAVTLKPLLDEVTQAMAAYALQVIAATDERDDASVRQAAHCLDALIELRSKTTRRGKADDDAQDDEATPTPAVPVDARPVNDTTRGRRVA